MHAALCYHDVRRAAAGAGPACGSRHRHGSLLKANSSVGRSLLGQPTGVSFNVADRTCSCRPFVWKGEVHLGHWISFRPAQERMAIASLDGDAHLVRFVHHFNPPRAAIEAAAHIDGLRPAAKAKSASAEQGDSSSTKRTGGSWPRVIAC